MRTTVVGLAAALVVGAGAALLKDGKPAGFEVLAHVNPGGGYAGDIVLHDRIAYLSSHRGEKTCFAAGVRVFDLHDPRKPRRVAVFADGASEPVLAKSWTEKTIVRTVDSPTFTGDLAVTSVQACALREGGLQGFALYDVSDPRRPVKVGGWGAWNELGLQPFGSASNTLEGNFVHSVIGNAAGTRAYLSYWNLGTVILDVSDPTKPRYVGRTRGATKYTHSAWLDEKRKLLVETHEHAGGKPILYRLRGDGDPDELATLSLSRRLLTAGHRRGGLAAVAGIALTDSVHDAKLDGTTAYFSWYSQGVVAADVSDPTQPQVIARFLPRPEKDPERLLCPDHPCVAVWGVDVGPGYVVASDLVSGLWVLKLNR